MIFYALMLCVMMVSVAPMVVSAAGLVPCSGSTCDFCSLVQMIGDIVTWLISFSTVAAGIAFAWAGFLMITAAGNMEQIKKGKNIFSNVLIGFLLMLGAWLIVDTILSMLVGAESSFFETRRWNEVNCG